MSVLVDISICFNTWPQSGTGTSLLVNMVNICLLNKWNTNVTTTPPVNPL